MALNVPNAISNGTPADGTEVNENFNVIEQYINTDVIVRDGSVQMTGQLNLVGNPVQSTHAAPKSYVDTILPVGIMMDYVGTTAPAGGQWLLCDGSALSTTSYPVLFDVIGYRYGGTGGTFNLPNFKGRVGVGLDSAQDRFNTTGKSGGTWVVPVPQHHHAMPHVHSMPHTHEHSHTHTFSDTSGTQSANHTHTYSDFTSADGAHRHIARTRTDSGTGGGGTVVEVLLDGGDPDFNSTGYVNTNNTADGAHQHAFSGTTSSNSASHTHSVSGTTSAPNESTTGSTSTNTGGTLTANTSDAGTANVEHLLPYVVCTKIIKAL